MRGIHDQQHYHWVTPQRENICLLVEFPQPHRGSCEKDTQVFEDH